MSINYGLGDAYELTDSEVNGDHFSHFWIRVEGTVIVSHWFRICWYVYILLRVHATILQVMRGHLAEFRSLKGSQIIL